MKEITKAIYKVTALSNLHVGSGDQNYGIVDKLVQRDPLTGFPVIHSSSLKGALKVYCEDVLGLEKDDPLMISSFGKGDSPGNDKFFTAHLFTLPVRADAKPFFRATCPSILNELDAQLKVFGLSDSEFAKAVRKLKEEMTSRKKSFTFFSEETPVKIIEEYELSSVMCDSPIERNDEQLKYIFNYPVEDYVIIQDNIFMEICENLPVIARNRLDEQKNLWYEEIVPRQSEFYFLHLGTNETKSVIIKKIEENSQDKAPVQIGANASVGYGFCKIDKLAEV